MNNTSVDYSLTQSSSPTSSTTRPPSSQSYPHSDQTHLTFSHYSTIDACDRHDRCDRAPHPPSAGTPGCGCRRVMSRAAAARFLEQAARTRGTGSLSSRRWGVGGLFSSLGNRRTGVGRVREIGGGLGVGGSCRIACLGFRRVAGRKVARLWGEGRIVARWRTGGLLFG